MGRTKIEIKRIESEERRQVAFSKRRAGIFKKASELSIMTGAETAVVCFSPGGKVFSFGHPDVNSVVDNYLAGRPYEHCEQANARRTIRQCSEKLEQITTELKNEKQIHKLNNETLKNRQIPRWQGPIENLGLRELELLNSSYEQLKQKVRNRENELFRNDFMQALFDDLPHNG